MNVRFFAGTKSTYLSLPKHNPQALYFCEDTQELYWGDYCLSDGIRIVPTIEDLPSLTNAADGIVYYISKTRNAYTLSPDRKSWLQTIYAPVRDASTVDESEVYNTVTTVGAVRDIEKALYTYIDKEIADIEKGDGTKAISFAGTQMTEINGTFTIDRESALRALGIAVPETAENVAIATEPYVNEIIAKKANEVPFSTDKFVTTAMGGFTVGESIKGLTMSEIIIRLLGLADKRPGEAPDIPDIPDIPDEPESIVDEVISKQLSMYSTSPDGILVAEDFEIIEYTPEQAASAPEKSGFYQIIENGVVIESGYQDLTIVNDEVYYVIALPASIDYNTMVTMQVYSPDEEKWEDCSKLPLINDSDVVAALCAEAGINISNLDTELYTIWLHEDICTGSIYRYIIKE